MATTAVGLLRKHRQVAASKRASISSHGSSAGSVHALQLDNLELRAQLQKLSQAPAGADAVAGHQEAERARAALRRVQAEKAALEAAAQEQRSLLMQAHTAQRSASLVDV